MQRHLGNQSGKNDAADKCIYIIVFMSVSAGEFLSQVSPADNRRGNKSLKKTTDAQEDPLDLDLYH